MNQPVKKNSLGRGLSALLTDANSQSTNETKQEASPALENFKELPIAFIEANANQPREYFDEDALIELAESIKVQGIIQPITVRQLAKDQYQIISGERRFRASQLAGLTVVPAYIRVANDQQMLEMALIENIQRENLNALEVALSYQRLITECSLKQEELGDRVGKNRATVNNYLRLLKLPPDIQAAVRDHKLSMGHARALINIENIDTQLNIFKKIINEDLSVRKVEELVRNIGKPKEEEEEKKSGKIKMNSDFVRLQSSLSSHFGTRIQIKTDDNKKGEIKIPFVTVEDLNRILEILHI
ncbi:MAG: hypothetical protein RLZZ175_417 [Bacteroidota bacterium]|jgi:ParB family chromosome partitioning protein